MEINENFSLPSSELAPENCHFVGLSLAVIVESQDTGFKQAVKYAMKLGTRVIFLEAERYKYIICQHVAIGAYPLFIHGLISCLVRAPTAGGRASAPQ